MNRVLLLAASTAMLLGAAPKKPKLVVFIVVDQCRYDYLTTFRNDYKGGFDRLLRNGAVFTRDNDDFFPTLTAPSHATLLTGAMPSSTGIAGNDWFDRGSRRHVTSVSDDSVKTVGSDIQEGASPARLQVETLGDELKKTHPRSRVIGIALKDRSAILLAGRKADGAFWFDEHTGGFVSSSYYGPKLPDWVQEFNDQHPASRFANAVWAGHKIPAGADGYKLIHRSPFGDELAEQLAERALAGEGLGKRADPDLLAVSLASVDYSGHDFGPGTPESRESLQAMDRTLGKLLDAVDREVGLGSALIVLTSDHGVPSPSDGKGGRVPLTEVSGRVQAALEAKYGPGKWVAGCWDLLLYLNEELIGARGLNREEVNRTAVEALRRVPHIARAYTREELTTGAAEHDVTARQMKDGFAPASGADIEFIPEPYWVFTALSTTHGSTYEYDTHVPLIFMGAGIAPAKHDRAVRSNDIAPTLAKVLGIPAPSGSVGHALQELD